MKILRILPRERKTFVYHLVYSIISGLILGLFTLNEFILIKSLKGSNYQIGFIVQSTVIVLSFSILINIILRSIRRKERFIRIVAILTRLPLILFAFFPTISANQENAIYYQIAFILIFLVYYMADPLLYPVINHLLKNSYTSENFGKLYGYASTVNKIMMLVSTLLFGLVLDYNHNAYKFVYPVTALLGFLSIYILTLIKYETDEQVETINNFWKSVQKSVKESISILKQNKPYRDFENAFFLYGLAWMATTAIIPIFFEKELGLNYSSIAFYKNAYNTISILILPFFGKIIGKIDPRKFAMVTFTCMLIHIFFLAFTQFYQSKFELWGITLYYSLIASYIWYGLFGAFMALLWYIGSAYFCRKDEVGNYQAVHVSLTGIRGCMAPILGIFLLDFIGYLGVFMASMISLGIAVFLMYKSMKNYPMPITHQQKTNSV